MGKLNIDTKMEASMKVMLRTWLHGFGVKAPYDIFRKYIHKQLCKPIVFKDSEDYIKRRHNPPHVYTPLPVFEVRAGMIPAGAGEVGIAYRLLIGMLSERWAPMIVASHG